MSSWQSNELLHSVREVTWQIENLYILVVFTAIGVLIVVVLQILSFFSSKINQKKDLEPTSVIIKPPYSVHASCSHKKKMIRPREKPSQSSRDVRKPIGSNGLTHERMSYKINHLTHTMSAVNKNSSEASTNMSLPYGSQSPSNQLNLSVKTPSQASSIASDIRNSKAPAVMIMKGPLSPNEREADTDSGSFMLKTSQEDQLKALNTTQSISEDTSDNEDSSDNEEDPPTTISVRTHKSPNPRRITEV